MGTLRCDYPGYSFERAPWALFTGVEPLTGFYPRDMKNSTAESELRVKDGEHFFGEAL